MDSSEHEHKNHKPQWLKKKISLKELHLMKAKLRGHGLHSVCESASCPNVCECFSKGIATVMIMGDVCTRACKFCNVKTGRPLPLDPKEPEHVAQWVKERGLKHVVVTSVDRDDLKDDYGATHYVSVIKAVHDVNPQTVIEILTPDFWAKTECLDTVCQTPIRVFNHNLETVERLTPEIRSVAQYRRSLQVLQYVKKAYPHIIVKSGLMLGLGETQPEVLQTLQDLRAVLCDVLTIGQYLAPSKNHYPVKEHIHPDQFEFYKNEGMKMGFQSVFAGPFVRSSYMAEEVIGNGCKA